MGARRRWVTIGVLVLVGLIGLIFAGYWFNWDWTGFNEHIGPRVPQYQPTKTLWDWLQLLIIPLVLAVAALLFNRATTRTEQQIAAKRYEQDQEIAAKRYEQDQEIALDKQREDLLQTYLDRMSELLLEKQLHSPASPYEIRNVTRDEVRNVARVRTITILFQLDARRIGYVFAFLREAGLMSTTSESIVSLKQANLTKINFSQAVITEVDLRDTNLYKADLSEAILYKANLSGAHLFGVDLSGADLSEANLSGAHLYKANLSGAHLFGVDLSGADLSEAILYKAHLYKANLSEANLSEANLLGADLSEANLSEANLLGADLSEAYLSEANLSRANLYKANLSGAIVTEAQLKKAKSLDLATMPDESKHR